MMFTCRADRKHKPINGNDKIEGSYLSHPFPSIKTKYGTNKAIDPSTLQLSFNGTDWYDVATIKEALTKQQVSNDVCKNCKYLGDEILLSSPAKRVCHNPYSAYSYLYHKEINIATCDKFEPKTLSVKGA